MSLKIKYHLKWNVTRILMSLNMECHSKRNVTHNGNVTQNGMSLRFRMERYSKWNVTLNVMSFKMEYHLK